MASFEAAYAHTSKVEGGYANLAGDRGGETYRGISRVHFANWEGWVLVDKYKPNQALMSQDLDLQGTVRAFYRRTFWNPFKADDIPSDLVAGEVYDSGVNCGLTRAVIWLQGSLNVLNRSGKLWANIPVDGKFGEGTLNCLKLCVSKGREMALYKLLNAEQAIHYKSIMRNDESQEEFALGWLGRVFEAPPKS
jgi:lysozyme family protein